MRRFALVVVLLFAWSGLTRAADTFYLKAGDCVVFYGDSITEQRLYTTFVETFVVTRFPRKNVTFVASGWGGDRVTGGGGGSIDVRLNRDVFAYKPTAVTVMLGMNDAAKLPFDPAIFETYCQGMERIVAKVKAELPNVRITLIRPSPYDDVTRPPKFEGGYNAVLVRYGESVQKLAEQAHVDLADLNAPVVAATKKAHESDPKLAQELTKDRFHPGPGGQLLMAAALLEAWHAPAIVTQVRLNVEGDRVKSQSEKTRVSDLTRDGATLSWIQLDDALPFPIDLKDPVTALAVRSSHVINQLDQEMLEVDGLDADYTLKIDGAEVGYFSQARLAAGVNLALLDTPMSAQAKLVHSLTVKHNDLHFQTWRFVQVPLQGLLAGGHPPVATAFQTWRFDQGPFPGGDSPHLRKALRELDRLEEDVVNEQRAAAQPKTHRYELRPTP